MFNTRATVNKLRMGLPTVAGVGGVVLVTVAANHLWGKKAMALQKNPITLVDNKTKYSLKLIEKEEISHDTRRFRFGLPSPDHVLGVPTGQHINLTAKIGKDVVTRPYTPISSDKDKGYVDLLIKVYFKNVNPKLPEGGKMSQHLESLNLNDTVDFEGPLGRLQYKGNGSFVIESRIPFLFSPTKVEANKINMIAGGSGITPMLQVIKHVCEDPNDKTQIKLLFANQTEDDILLRNELERYQKEYPEKFSVWYTVDKPKDGWKYSTGFVTEDMIREHLFPASDDVFVLMCGPPPMVFFACNPALNKLNFPSKSRFAY